jgi:short-subunit dehydrogenase
MFDEVPKEEHLAVMRVNMEAPVRLTHALLPELLKAQRAYVLNISSMSAYNALASMAVYAGSKAFVLNWSRSLRIELRSRQVHVTCVCPGSVITGFTERAGMQAMDELARRVGTGPEPVARAAVRAMLKGKAEVVPGFTNQIAAVLQKLMPVAITERVASSIYLKRLRNRKTT